MVDGYCAQDRLNTSRSPVINTEAAPDRAIENWIANREDMSHAQRNHELWNYESNGEHSITRRPPTQAAGVRLDFLRSSLRELQTVLRCRACGLSGLRLRRSYFTSNLTRPPLRRCYRGSSSPGPLRRRGTDLRRFGCHMKCHGRGQLSISYARHG